MTRTIWKYPLEIQDDQTIEMPEGAEILTVQAQADKPCLWAMVDPTRPIRKRHIEIYGTGHPMFYHTGQARKYISTFQMFGGSLVYHVFEYTEI